MELPFPPEDADAWTALYKTAHMHRLLPLVYGAMREAGACAKMPPAMAQAWRREAIGQAAGQAVRTRRFLELYRQMYRAGIPCIVMKGILLRAVYPEPDLRISADEDLLLRPGDMARAAALLGAQGFQESPAGAQVRSFFREDLSLELHTRPWAGEALDFFAHARRIRVEGVELLSPSPMEHLLILILHAMKHFVLGGVGLRQIMDVNLYARRYGEQIDFAGLGGLLLERRGLVFAANLFAIGREGLGLALDPFPGVEVDPAPLLKDALEAGIYGQSSMERRHSAAYTGSAAEGGSPLLDSLFPRAEDLCGRYPYLKTRPWLLPAAWFTRLWRYAAGPKGRAGESLRLGRARRRLVERYGVTWER